MIKNWISIKSKQIKFNLNERRKLLIEKFKYLFDITRDSWNNDPGILIFVTMIVFGCLQYNPALYMIIGLAFYITLIIKRRYDSNRRSKIIDDIDLEKFGNTENSLTVILDQYISECFTRDVLFIRGIRDKEYISEKEETQMLKLLLDSVAANMGIYTRQKFDRYFGENRTDIILARKCYITVSMYVANNNKNIYSK